MEIDCVLVSNGHVSQERLKTTGRKVVSDLNEFINVLN